MKLIEQKIVYTFFSLTKIKPDTFIAGFQKCGTTTLYDTLSKLNDFHPGKIKENDKLSDDFFSIFRYLQDFPNSINAKKKRSLCGSHQISYVPIGLDRLKTYFPNSKIIFIMRNPTDRAISRYQHNQRKQNAKIDKRFPFSFEDLCDIEFEIIEKIEDIYDVNEIYEKTSYINPYGLPITRGIYYPFVKRFIENGFSCYFLSLEDLIEDWRLELRKLLDFLEIDKRKINSLNLEALNKGNYVTLPPSATIERLNEFYASHNDNLFNLIGKEFKWNT